MNLLLFRRLAALLLIGAVAVAPHGLRAEDRGSTSSEWRQFRGPTGYGASEETGLPERWGPDENIVWKARLPGAGTSTPVVVGDDVILCCYSGFGVQGEANGTLDDLRRTVVCLDRRDGSIRWTTEVESKLPEQATIRDGHGYASSTPFVDDERIYAFFGKSGAVALDRAGERLWQADVGDGLHGWGSAASPVVHGELAIVNASVESETLFAFDKETGEEVWRARGIKDSWNTPIFVTLEDGRTELVLAIFGQILGFDPETGKRLWSCETDIGWYMVPSLVADGEIVYCVGGRSGGALAVRAGGKGDVTNSHRLWTGKKGSNVTSPVFLDGHLYWMHEVQGIAYCAEGETGRIVYEKRLDGADQVYASALLADGKIYYVTRSGRTFVVAARPRFELVATNDLEDGSIFNSGPAAAGGRLYLRSDRFLYCIGRE